ncbi:MAG: LemA family protein [Oscillospiraceae bacterium]|nr:LemA family protein [Candidatus Equicaccousia limihippi]
MGVIALVVIIIVGSIIGTYNSMVTAKAGVDESFSNIQTQLQRRADLIPNFVNTVKGAAEFEQTTLTDVTKARGAVAGATDAQSLSKASGELDKAISVWVNAVTESYPQLKANSNFTALQDELAGTENRIAVARKDFNAVAKEYNVKITKFPANIFAGMFGFEKTAYFEADEASQSVPQVNF